jgi:hypothetical protein
VELGHGNSLRTISPVKTQKWSDGEPPPFTTKATGTPTTKHTKKISTRSHGDTEALWFILRARLPLHEPIFL